MSENFSSHIDSITTAFNNLQRDKDIITEKYYVLFKALSVVKNNLEDDDCLEYMSDSGYSFKEIAKTIEKEWENL